MLHFFEEPGSFAPSGETLGVAAKMFSSFCTFGITKFVRNGKTLFPITAMSEDVRRERITPGWAWRRGRVKGDVHGQTRLQVTLAYHTSQPEVKGQWGPERLPCLLAKALIRHAPAGKSADRAPPSPASGRGKSHPHHDCLPPCLAEDMGKDQLPPRGREQ